MIIGNAGHPEVEGIMGWAHRSGGRGGVGRQRRFNPVPEEGFDSCVLRRRRRLTTINFKNWLKFFGKKGYDISRCEYYL